MAWFYIQRDHSHRCVDLHQTARGHVTHPPRGEMPPLSQHLDWFLNGILRSDRAAGHSESPRDRSVHAFYLEHNKGLRRREPCSKDVNHRCNYRSHKNVWQRSQSQWIKHLLIRQCFSNRSLEGMRSRLRFNHRGSVLTDIDRKQRLFHVCQEDIIMGLYTPKCTHSQKLFKWFTLL